MAEKEHLVLYFSQPVHGLNLGSPVKIQGVEVGQVEGIQIAGPLGAEKDYYAKVKVVLRAEVLREKGLATNLEQEAVLRQEISQGLRGKMSLLSPMMGSYYVALGYRPGSPVRLVGAEENEAEVPVLDNELIEAGETVAEKIVRLGERNIAADAREWEARLDQWLAATRPENFAAVNTAVLSRLDRAGALLGPEGIPAEISRINDGLARFRAALDGRGRSMEERLWDGRVTLGTVQSSLNRVNQQALDLMALLEVPRMARHLQLPPEAEIFREWLERMNRGQIFPPERMLPQGEAELAEEMSGPATR